MKKLMTMLAAVGMAFGLFAADAKFISGAGFDTSDTVQLQSPASYTWLNNTELAPDGFVTGYWMGTEKASIVFDTYTCAGGHPLQFDQDAGRNADQYLKIESGTDLVSQRILPGSATKEIGDDGLYFDGLVQFTSFEEAPAIDADAKIAVFPMVDDPDADTPVSHLIIKAFGTETNLWTTTETMTDDAWRRVTIKMIKNIKKSGTPQVGFVVFLDGSNTPVRFSSENDSPFNNADLTPEAAYFNGLNALFGSLIEDTAEITDVAFGGKGAIDEIAFTETAPTFAGSPKFAWIKGAEHIASFEYDTKTWNEGNDALIVQILPIGATTGTADVSNIKAAEGYFVTETTAEVPVTAGETNTVGAATALGATVKIEGQDDQYFASAAEALTKFLNTVKIPTEAKLVLNAETSDAITIDNENLTLTLDLAGNEIKSENVDAITVTAGTLTIIDSDPYKQGKVIARSTTEDEEPSYEYAVAADSAVVAIQAGTFDGSISLARGSLISGGKFLIAANELEEALNLWKPEDAEFVEDGEGYWKLQTVTDFTVEVPEAEANTKLMVTIDDVAAGDTNGTYTVAKNSTLKAVYTADEGYELVGQGEWTIGYNTVDKTITAPTAKQIMVDFTVAGFTGAELLAVSNGNEEVEFKDNKYTVPTNATVTLYYAPAQGYRLTKTTATKQITDADQVVDVSDEIAPAEITYVAQINDDPTKKYETLAEAVAALKGNETIKLLKPYQLPAEGVTFNKNCTFDLGGNTLTVDGADANSNFWVTAAVTFKNGTITETNTDNRPLYVQDGATLNLTNVEITAEGSAGPAIDVIAGTINVYADTKITSQGDVFRIKEEGAYETTINVYGGELKTTGSRGIFYHYKLDGRKLFVNIYGGEFTASESCGVFQITGNADTTCSLGADCKAKFSTAKGLDAFYADGYKAFKAAGSDWYTIVAAQVYTANLYVDGTATGTIELGTGGQKFAKGESVVATKPGVIDNTVEPDFAQGKTYYVEKLVLFGDPNKVCEFEYDGTTLTKKGTDQIGVDLANNILTYTVVTGDLNPFGAVYVKEYVAPSPIDPVDPEQPIKDKSAEEVNKDLAKYLDTSKLPSGVDATEYVKLFVAVDTPNGAEIVLTDAATNTITQTVEAETKKIPVSKIAAGTATEIAVTGATPGIWYQLNAAATLEGMTYVDEVQCPASGSFSFENGLQGATGDTARFFKISASATKRYTNKGNE